MDVSCVAMRKKRARKGDVALSEADTVSNCARGIFDSSTKEAVKKRFGFRALRLEFRCSLLRRGKLDFLLGPASSERF